MIRRAPVAEPQADIDLAEARRFLEALDPGATKFTFQTFDDNPDRDLKNRKLSRHHTDTFDNCADSLKRANRQHAGVFASINETDGLGRKKENITAVRALMLDLDGAPLDPVLVCPLKPHIITETSAGNYHVFWRVNGLPRDQFEALQRGLAKKFDGDPAVATLERCTRIPGFFHCKDIENRFLTRIVETNDLPPYTADELLAEFQPEKKPHKAAGSRTDALVLIDNAPVPNAEKFIELRYQAAGVDLLRSYRGAFYSWTGTHWREMPTEVLEHELYQFTAPAVVDKNGSFVPFNPTKSKVNEIAHVLRRGPLIDHRTECPCWLDGHSGRSAQNLVACRNGILNLQTRELEAHDPHFFTTNCLPLDYASGGPKPKQWLKFLEQIWPEDEAAEFVLQEMFGYLLTTDTRQQKLFLLVGPKRGGKGTIVHVLSRLLGDDSVVSVTLKSMAGEFGRWPLIDKQLAVIADARLSARADAHAVAEHLLSISGGDQQSINRKLQPFWSGFLSVRFLITTNELPAITDASGTLPSRFIVLRLTESFYGREDLDLKDKLTPELPSILNWALDGLDRLRKRGYFQIPKSSQESIREMEDLASPVRAFLREWGEVAADERVNVKTLFKAYKSWADESGHKAAQRHMFGRALRSLVPKLRTTGVGANRSYVGVALSERGQEEWDSLMQEKGRR